MKKKVLLSMVLLTMVGASFVFAQQITDGNLTYIQTGNTLIVKAANKNITGHVTIPDSYQGKNVVALDTSGFAGCKEITGVTIPNRITKIPVSVFKDCTKLQSITLHNGITEIFGSAFQNSGLLKIRFPDSLTSIGDNAFRDCKYLYEIEGANIGKNVKTIGAGAFQNTWIDRVWIRENVTNIGANAFNTGNPKFLAVNFAKANIRFATSSFPNAQNLWQMYSKDGKTGRYLRNGTTWAYEGGTDSLPPPNPR